MSQLKGLPLVSQSKLASPAEECPKGRVQQGELRFCPAWAGFFAHLAFPWCELIIFGIKNQICAWPLEHKEPRPLFFFLLLFIFVVFNGPTDLAPGL